MMARPVIVSFALMLGVMLAGCASTAARPAPAIIQTLAPEGALRVALYTGTPTSLLSQSDLRGVGYELGKELARRLGVAFEPIVFPKNAEVLDAIIGGRADVAFTNASAERAKQVSFTQAYLLIEIGYLARPGVQVTTLAEVDQPGLRVGVTALSSSDSILSRELRHAQVVRAETVAAGVEMLADGDVDLYATNKATLFEMADKLPGARVLAGNWGVERHAMALPPGRERGLPYARAFIADAIGSGLAQQAAKRAGLRGASVVRASP